MRLLSVFLIVMLLFVIGCSHQRDKISESVSEETKPSQGPGQEAVSQEKPSQDVNETGDVGITDQELADLENELNKELVEDVEEISFE